MYRFVKDFLELRGSFVRDILFICDFFHFLISETHFDENHETY